MSPRLAFALDVATRAGRSTLAHFDVGVAVESKADASPVTIADRNAERIVREAIEKAFPGDAVLGEEEGADRDCDDRWVVDPIDGTKSFICGVPLYSTLVSYEVDRQPVLGVVFFPALNEILFAETGSGAFINGRPCHVNSRETLDGGVLCCGGHRSMIKHDRWIGFAGLAERALITRTWSDAYGHALVASGRADAMVDPIVSRWDLSAVKIVVREAGGQFTDFDGRDPFLKGDDNLAALSSNGRVHAELLRAFES